MSEAASVFTAGFAARHAAAADVLQAAFSPPPGFAPRDPRARANGRPRHFSPADPTARPTEGWNPLDADAEPSVFIDPVEAAHAAGYAEGLAAATIAARDDASRDETLLAELVTALKSGGQLDRERTAAHLRQTVMFLVKQLVGDVGISADMLAGRIEAAADLLADAAESALLRLHPDDVKLVEGKLPKTVFAAGDVTLTRGSFVLESASTLIEDGPGLWLEQLTAAIDRVPVPRAC
jgi:flagellar assembly protein FliH